MVKELLVTKELNREMIDAGAALANELEAKNFDATVVLWLFLDEFDEWRIVVGSPDVDKLGPMRVYEKFQTILADMKNDANGLRLSNIMALGEKKSPIAALRQEATESGGIEEGRIRGPVSSDYIVDSWIYRVKPLEKK
jgi:hypothetical protein